MNQIKVHRILRTLNLLKGEGIAGGTYTAGEIARWAGMPRATTYRYLKKLWMLGMVENHDGERRKRFATTYAISPKGCELVQSQLELKL